MASLWALASRRRAERWTSRVAWAWCVLVLVIWPLLLTISESFLPATLLAYGPRIVLVLPFVVLLPIAVVASRTALVPLMLAALVVAGPIMGARVSHYSLGRSAPEHAPSGALRVLTFNTEGGGVVAMQLRDAIERLHPDLLALQECGDALWDTLQALPSWYHHREASLCTASRWPMSAPDVMPRSDFARIATYGFGGTGLVVRYAIDAPSGRFHIVNLLLETARKGLEGLSGAAGFIPDRFGASSGTRDDAATALERINLNAQIRERESERAAIWASRGDQRIPLIIMGDFNLPVESSIFRRHWSTFTDAFEAAGSGFGWSKQEGSLLRIRIRIDHVLTRADGPTPIGTWLGPDLGSDHLPVIADLALRH